MKRIVLIVLTIFGGHLEIKDVRSTYAVIQMKILFVIYIGGIEMEDRLCKFDKPKTIEGGIIGMEFIVEGQKEGPIMRIVLDDGSEFCFTGGFCPVRKGMGTTKRRSAR